MSGPNNPRYDKAVSKENKELISKLWSKYVYLYDANTFSLIAKYDRH